MNEDPINPPGFPPKRSTVPLGAIEKLRKQNTDPRFPLSDGVRLIISPVTKDSPPEQQMEAEILRMMDLNGQKLNQILQISDKMEKDRQDFNTVRYEWNKANTPEKLVDRVEVSQSKSSWSLYIAVTSFAGMIISGLIAWNPWGK